MFVYILTILGGSKNMRNNYQAVSVPIEMIGIIDKAIKDKGFSSRAEFVKQAIRNELERLKT
jgi:metal-responsive CopG/Arc/MetJ family transcriptional regulator